MAERVSDTNTLHWTPGFPSSGAGRRWFVAVRTAHALRASDTLSSVPCPPTLTGSPANHGKPQRTVARRHAETEAIHAPRWNRRDLIRARAASQENKGIDSVFSR
ncbi:hypothetical protein GCM10027396_21920 [Insolitispirillum peregrinum]